MNDRTVLGCWAVLVGIPVALVLAWMAFDALLYAGTTLGTDGPVALLWDPLAQHAFGQWLVLALLVSATYLGTLGGRARLARFAARARWLAMLGGALELVAWARWPTGARGAGWALLLGFAGVATPWLAARQADPRQEHVEGP